MSNDDLDCLEAMKNKLNDQLTNVKLASDDVVVLDPAQSMQVRTTDSSMWAELHVHMDTFAIPIAIDIHCMKDTEALMREFAKVGYFRHRLPQRRVERPFRGKRLAI